MNDWKKWLNEALTAILIVICLYLIVINHYSLKGIDERQEIINQLFELTNKQEDLIFTLIKEEKKWKKN